MDILGSCRRIAYILENIGVLILNLWNQFLQIQGDDVSVLCDHGSISSPRIVTRNYDCIVNCIVKNHARFGLRMMRMKQTSKRLVPQK